MVLDALIAQENIMIGNGLDSKSRHIIHCAKPPFPVFQGYQTVDAHAARAPAPPTPTQGGGTGLSYHVFRGGMTGRYLAS